MAGFATSGGSGIGADASAIVRYADRLLLAVAGAC